MGTVAISYSSIKDASREAKTVARKLDDYADELVRSVYNKLNRYKGEWTGNISSASTSINNKVNELRTAAGEYETYATDLKDLREDCKETDKTVKSRISSLTASFKEDHGIRNSKVEYAINYLLTSAGNSSAAGRWLGEGKDWIDGGIDYVRQSIKDWFNYEGGKQFLKGIGEALLGAVIAIAGIVGGIAVLLGGPGVWAAIAAIAGIVGGIIGLANASANITCECFALHDTWASNDPATGRRTSKLDSLSDVFHEWTDNKFLHGVGTGLDILEFAATAITVVDGLGKLLTKGAKWLTCADDLSKLSVKDVLSGIKGRTEKIRYDFKLIEMAFRTDAKDAIRLLGKGIVTDFFANLKGTFWNFEDLKKGSGSVKAMANFAKDILVDGPDLNDFAKHIGMNGIGFLSQDVNKDGGVLAIPKPGNAFTLNDINKITNINKKIYNPIFSSLEEHLSMNSGISVSVPEVHVPKVSFTTPDINFSMPEITILNAN